MTKHFWFFAISLLLVACCHAQELEAASGIRGLLKLPSLYGSEACDDSVPVRSISLFRSPRPPAPGSRLEPSGFLKLKSSPVAGDCGAREVTVVLANATSVMPSLEYGYEQQAAIVTDSAPGFYEIATGANRRAWVRSADAGAYLPIPEILGGQLLYLTDYAPVPEDLKQESVELMGTERRSGQLWLRVKVPDENPCTGEKLARAGASHVLPFYGASGKPSVWFFSRGC